MIKNDDMVTLFLIEDDDVDALTIERLFTKRRIANPLVRAHDGMQALEMLRSGELKKPYIILLDLQMPRMNGLEFLAEIRDDADLSDSVVFVLTTSKSEEDLIAAYKNQIAGYFLKEDSDKGLFNIVELLDGYWKIAYLPK